MRRLTGVLVSVIMVLPLAACGTDSPLVIGHRGASGTVPEHTIASYQEAIAQCADFIEPDLVSTSDRVLVARHENELSTTTDVADHPEFFERRTAKVIDGREYQGWFVEDFTAAEIATLRARERLPDVRPDSAELDGQFPVPTLAEILTLASDSSTCDGDEVGVHIELKHPTYLASQGLRPIDPLVTGLKEAGLDGDSDEVIIQSADAQVLRQLDADTDLTLMLLVGCGEGPLDGTAGEREPEDWLTPSSLTQISEYADGIGPCKDLLIPRTEDGRLGTPTTVVADAHEAGLFVHPYTFRAENRYLPVEFRLGDAPNAHGDLSGEVGAFLDLEIDGFFTDHPDLGVKAVSDHSS